MMRAREAMGSRRYSPAIRKGLENRDKVRIGDNSGISRFLDILPNLLKRLILHGISGHRPDCCAGVVLVAGSVTRHSESFCDGAP